ncbi:MAG: asparagine--tRNA ligase [Culicoidibacterales bacterium]
METVAIRKLYRQTESFIGQTVKVSGWIRTNRDQKEFGFIMLNDGTFFQGVQVVYTNELHNFESIAKFGVSTAVTVIAEVVATPNAKQAFELKAQEVSLEGECPSEYPLQPKRHSMEYLRTIAHLRPRTNLFSAVFRVRSLTSYAIHKFFQDRHFVYAHTPIITGSDAEGAGEMFSVTTINPSMPPMVDGHVDYKEDFFGKHTNLTVSGQLEAEAFALAFRDVYTFGPTFRAENSNTTRHAAEFWMIEPEIAFADLNDDMDLAEAMVKYVIQYVLEHAPEEIEFFNQFVEKGLKTRLETLVTADFHRVSYTDAIKILEQAKKKFENPVSWGIDLSTEHERYLTDEVYKAPVFVTDYPKEIKSFYMRLNDDQKTVAAMDMLVPGIGELIGGSQREERLDVLEARMDEIGVPKEELWWYLDLRRFGGVKHAGFGLGFERMVMYLTGVENIRDVIPFPRTPKNAEF